MQPTSRQQEAITRGGQDVLVTASAGTGKTEVLSRRVLHLLVSHDRPTRIDRLLVVTFTRAAAAELRERIAKALLGRTCPGGGVELADSAVRRRLAQQVDLLDTSHIETIDAWCQRLVRSEFVAAGVDPGFGVLEPPEAGALRQQVLQRLFEWLYRSADELACRARAWIESHREPSDGFLMEMILQLNLFREHLVSPAAWLAEVRRHASQSAAAASDGASELLLAAVAEECNLQLRALSRAAGDGAAPVWMHDYGARLRGWAAAGREALVGVLDEISIYRLPQVNAGSDEESAAIGGAGFRDVEAWFKQRIKERFDTVELQRWMADCAHTGPLLLTLLDLEERYQRDLLAAKQSRGRYEFADIQRFALNLLWDRSKGIGAVPTPIALAVRQRYDHILVDEFQDTSPVQAEIFEAIGRREPQAGNRFFVGDVKQSIYGFRRAEPRLFAERAAATRQGQRNGLVLELTDNFRTHPGILAGLNRLFEQLFEPELGGSPYGESERLTAGRAEIENPTLDADPRISVHVLPWRKEFEEDDESVTPAAAPSLERVEREAGVVAREISDMLRRGVQIPQAAADGRPALRPLRPADIAVLIRTAHVKASQVARMLRKAGIVCAANGRESILDWLEAQDLCHALRLIGQAGQDVPLASYLRGPYVGASESQLLALRRHRPEGDFHQAVSAYRRSGDDAALREILERAFDQLDRWRIAARTLDLPALVRRILQDMDGDCLALSQPAGEQRLAALEALCELAAEFNTGGIHDFVAMLDESQAAEQAPRAPVVGDPDAVQVMTIHASKGLEFPIVFLIDAGSRFNLKSASAALQLHDRLGAGLRFFHRPGRAAWRDVRHALIADASLAREKEEELRLLYVAATRAREKLFIVGHGQARALDAFRAPPSLSPQPVPLVHKLSAACVLDWLAPALRAIELRKFVAVQLETPAPEPDGPNSGATLLPMAHGPPEAQDDDVDSKWVERGAALLQAAAFSGAFPATLSATGVRDLAREGLETAGGRGRAIGSQRLGGFPWESSAGEVATRALAGDADGLALGVLMHQFLRHADLAVLADHAGVEREVMRLLHAGLLSEPQAEGLDRAGLAWFGGTELCAALAGRGSALQREAPFVWGERLGETEELTLVRGVLDVLVADQDGVQVVDYKTDRLRSDEALSARAAEYGWQVRAYAEAVRAATGFPIRRLSLVFLAARQIVEIDPIPLNLPAIWKASRTAGRTPGTFRPVDRPGS